MKILLPLLLFAIAIISVVAQTKRSSVGERNIPFDLAATKLPFNFKGHDPSAIALALSKRAKSLDKQEFETTAAYLERKQKIKSSPFLGDLMADSLLGFVVPADIVETKYDADSGFLLAVLPMSLDTRDHCYRSSTILDCRMIELVRKSDLSYFVGQNIFGASTSVAHFTGVQIAVDFNESLTLAVQDRSRVAYRMKFPASSPQEAVRMKTNIRAILVGSLANLEVTPDTITTTPTLDHPVKLEMNALRIHLGLKEIWFYDGVSGVIYGRIDQEAVKNAK